MPRKSELRRSRSWKDLSSFMSKKLFATEAEVPNLPLRRTSSLNRGQRKEACRSRMFHDFDIVHRQETIPTIESQRPKERTLLKRASLKRKAAAPKRSPQQQPRANQLPSFTFPPQASGPKSAGAQHSRSHSRNMSTSTAHSRKISQMSVPLVLDFDLAHPLDPSSATPINGFDFGFISSPVIDRDLTPEEKASLINSAAPMHIIQIPSQKPTKKNSLKRLFSLRKADKGSPSSSKLNSPQEIVPPRHSIYTRPPAVGRRTLPSPPSSPGSAPPRLTVQIPDSKFERASKIFQSIYAAHASAQESYSTKEQWGIPTPVSASPPFAGTVITGDEIQHIKNAPEDVSMLFNAEGRTVPKRGKWSLMPNVEMKGKTDRLWEKSDYRSQLNQSPQAATTKPEVPQLEDSRPFMSTSPPTPISAPAKARIPVQVPLAGTRGRISAFPLPVTKVVPLTIYESTDEYDSSEEEDFRDSDDEWEDERKSNAADESMLKEPAWEMLTPANKSRR